MKRILSLCLVVIIVISSSSMVFAGNKDMGVFKQKVSALPGPTSEYYNQNTEQLIKETDPAIVQQFIDSKLTLAETKIKEYRLNLKSNNITNNYIDLGDNCYVKVTLVDSNDGISLYANTPGATTLWKAYGDRLFTVSYEIYLAVIYYNLYFTNHYTLSSTGIKVRYGEAWVTDSGLGAGSAGTINTTKSTATVGQTVSMNCIFTLRAGIEGVGINKNFKMFNNVKCSEIDTIGQQVKVVQSWTGAWL